MKLTQSQIVYTRNRIDDVADAKKLALRKKFMTPEVELDNQEKIRLVKAGKVKMKSGISKKYSLYFDDVYDFSDLESKEKFDKDAYEKEAAKIDRRVTELKDELVLGDQQKALDLLKAWEK